MSNARKLQTEIDRVMKKVDEGVELFDDIWEKVYSAEQQNQKEKYEVDLKKEIKKLQRLRDQIKTWISSSDVKDKEPLLEARRLIETKMEQFKICEKETKTKTYSKEGLARQERLDPSEQAKRDTTDWISEIVERLGTLVEEHEVEIERLSVGKGKKTNKPMIDDFIHYIVQHKYHISKLEGIMRLVNNDVLDVDAVNPIREDLEYYIDSYDDEDYQQAYDEDFFYEALGLDELDVVNVDRVTQAVQPAVAKKKEDSDNASTSTKGSKGDKKSKKAVSSVIPFTIGRARVSSGSSKGKGKKEDEDSEKTPKKREPTPTTIPAVPAARPAPPPPAAGASMAAILKRETEQQEKERQKARQAEQLRIQQQQAQAQAAQQQLLQRQQQEAQLRQQEEALRQQQRQEAAAAAAAKQKALQQQQQQQQQQEALRQQQQAQQEALKRQQAQAQQQVQVQQEVAKAPQLQSQVSSVSSVSSGMVGLEILSGLGGLSLDGSMLNTGVVAASTDGSNYLSALNESFATMPNAADNERSRHYTPQNPYPTPSSYPSTPSHIFDNPQIFEKLGTDALFFIFYYMQGTYQQYLAARELKKQSWRFHKKYMTWFQRHEEPKVTTDEYEQGTYVYFDYETGWCTRIKQDFRFEYSFLEDSLQ